METVSPRTFWSVVGALFLVGGSIVGMVWADVSSHRVEPYHPGTPFYVEQRLDIVTKDLTVEIKGLREDIQKLREAMIAAGTDLR